MRWSLQGNEQQNAIIQEALDRCDFPFDAYAPTRVIPVLWEDLSRYATDDASVPHAEHDHDHPSPLAAEVRTQAPPEQTRSHANHDDGDPEGYDVLAFRSRVLGLAWYSGKVSIERSLVSDPTLAMEVFLSEGAHMVDFFGMTDEHRRLVWNAVHPPHQHLAPGTDIRDGIDLGHGHSWFDVGGYYSWVGEAFMGLFVRAFSDLPVTIAFHHPATDEAARLTRVAFLGEEPEPTPEPVPPAPEPEPVPPTPDPDGGDGSPDGSVTYFASRKGRVYHDTHGNIAPARTFDSKDEAEAAGLRPCKTCKP